MGHEFLKLGAKVTFSDVNQKGLDESLQQVPPQYKNNACAVICDVSSVEAVKEAAKKAREAFGDVTILINNAGIVHGKKIIDVPAKLAEKTLQVNTLAHIYTIKEFLPSMIEKKKGHIVSLASLAGITGVNGLADYCASKAGAVFIDESLRLELRNSGGLHKNIRTTSICPYYINTGMFDGVNSPIFPLLESDYVVQRTIQAIQQEEYSVYIPWAFNIIPVARSLLPVPMYDRALALIGVNKNMDDFKGRL